MSAKVASIARGNGAAGGRRGLRLRRRDRWRADVLVFGIESP
jgi:hypothetical protein